MPGTILVTGGTGYIGAHTVVKLLDAGFPVVVLDNLCNSSRTVIDRIQKITGKPLCFVEGDVRDRHLLQNTLQRHSVSAVIHFAGLKAVAESEAEPLTYYDNNVSGSLILFEEMARAGIHTAVFSSSATVYGESGSAKYGEKYCEDRPLAPVSVYGKTKLMVENILRDLKKAQPQWRIALLRYFNPAGAHHSGLIGEDPSGVPNNLMPFVAQVAVGKRESLSVFGNDYPTPDGTGLRDYIHVEDLASGHLAALNVLNQKSSLITLNLGTGRPVSVLEMIAAFEKASGRKIPWQTAPRRAGDIAACFADPTRAQEILGWKATLDIDRMCQDAWRWQRNHPEGYC